MIWSELKLLFTKFAKTRTKSILYARNVLGIFLSSNETNWTFILRYSRRTRLDFYLKSKRPKQGQYVQPDNTIRKEDSGTYSSSTQLLVSLTMFHSETSHHPVPKIQESWWFGPTSTADLTHSANSFKCRFGWKRSNMIDSWCPPLGLPQISQLVENDHHRCSKQRNSESELTLSVSACFCTESLRSRHEDCRLQEACISQANLMLARRKNSLHGVRAGNLLYHRSTIWHSMLILNSWHPLAANNMIKLSISALLYIRPAGKDFDEILKEIWDL